MLKVKFQWADLILKAEVAPEQLKGETVDIDFDHAEITNFCRIRFEKHNDEWIAQNGVNGHGDNIRNQVIGKKLQVGECDPDLLEACQKLDKEKEIITEDQDRKMAICKDFADRWMKVCMQISIPSGDLPGDQEVKILELLEHLGYGQK